MNKIKTILIFLSFLNLGVAQTRFDIYEQKLDSLSSTMPGIYQTVSLNISGVSLSDFINALAAEHNLNVSVESSLNQGVINNFYNARVKDVLIFLARKYELELNFIGTIISIKKYEVPPKEPIPYVAKDPKIVFYKTDSTVDFTLRGDSLFRVAEKIANVTGFNVVYQPGLGNQKIDIVLVKTELPTAMEKLAFANGFKVEFVDDIYTLTSQQKDENEAQNNPRNRNNNRNSSRFNATAENNDVLELSVTNGLISLEALNSSIKEIIEKVSSEVGVDYFIYSEIEGNTSLYFRNLTYDSFLNLILKGTKYGYDNKNEIFLIGERSSEGIRKTTQYQFQYRTVEKLSDYIPAKLKENLEIKEFIELNSFIISGNEVNIDEITHFFREIDRPVPMVYIEMIIVDANRSKSISTGVEFGISDEPNTGPTNGGLSPFDIELSPFSINNIINSLNGFGFINLGNVTENFYLNLNALEQNGNIDIKSTPKLSTLNGHEAKISIGETTYYLEVNNQVLNNAVNQNILQAQQWKPLDADLTITVTPYVSGDEQVTLDILLDQNDFTEQTAENAPRGKTKRSFKSLIRVKNNEVVLMGGLEKQESSKSGSGIPILSRIPIIKWFFSSRSDSERDTRLNIFIKPTIIY